MCGYPGFLLSLTNSKRSASLNYKSAQLLKQIIVVLESIFSAFCQVLEQSAFTLGALCTSLIFCNLVVSLRTKRTDSTFEVLTCIFFLNRVIFRFCCRSCDAFQRLTAPCAEVGVLACSSNQLI